MALVENKKAFLNYEITDRLHAGVSLVGHEVRALKAGKASLVGSYIIVRGNEAFLVGATIQPYQEHNTPDGYDPLHPRKLLLTKKEIAHLIGIEKEKGLTAIPLNAHLSRNKVKIEIGIARSKKKYDKRQTLKKRDANRDIERATKTKR
ncbi:MAG: SsrA-binding protein SmpB [bacterium]|nr:SsrA-binding protein SmpB [bacterium]